MLRQRCGSFPGVSAASGVGVSCQVRGFKAKKRNKFGQPFVKESQPWRDEWRKSKERRLAENLREYANVSTTERIAPWDSRFAPFDREERDGVYIVMRYLMSDKLALSHHHANPVKRLFCNVGLIGPHVTTRARWKPNTATLYNAKATTAGPKPAAFKVIL